MISLGISAARITHRHICNHCCIKSTFHFDLLAFLLQLNIKIDRKINTIFNTFIQKICEQIADGEEEKEEAHCIVLRFIIIIYYTCICWESISREYMSWTLSANKKYWVMTTIWNVLICACLSNSGRYFDAFKCIVHCSQYSRLKFKHRRQSYAIRIMKLR